MQCHSEQINEICAALAAFQAEMPAVKKEKYNTFSDYHYADLADVLNQAKPHLSKNGLAITQPLLHEDGNVWLKTIVMHTSGQWIMSRIALQSDANKKMNKLQEMGSGITYARRYAVGSLLGIATDDDDDAHDNQTQPAQQQRQPAKPDQKPQITVYHGSIPYAFDRLSDAYEKLKELMLSVEGEERAKIYDDNNVVTAALSKSEKGRPLVQELVGLIYQSQPEPVKPDPLDPLSDDHIPY